jgi:hypothetical protein
LEELGCGANVLFEVSDQLPVGMWIIDGDFRHNLMGVGLKFG